jgi:hypothetical protein
MCFEFFFFCIRKEKQEWQRMSWFCRRLRTSSLPLYQHRIKQWYHILINHAKWNKRKKNLLIEKYLEFYFPKICAFKLTDISLTGWKCFQTSIINKYTIYFNPCCTRKTLLNCFKYLSKNNRNENKYYFHLLTIRPSPLPRSIRCRRGWVEYCFNKLNILSNCSLVAGTYGSAWRRNAGVRKGTARTVRPDRGG